MNKVSLSVFLLLALAVSAFGQANQPQPKSQEEVEALMAIQNAQTADQRIEAANKLLTDFKDTEFKEMAYYMLMASYQQKNDFENMLIFGERTLEANPENVGALLSLAYVIPLRTREFDLDKEEKLSKAESYAKRALRIIPTLESPNPNTPPEQWLLAKKDFMSQAHESLGTIALLRNDYSQAEESLRQALQVAAEQSAATFYKLGRALKEQGKYDEAIAALEKSIERGGMQMGGGRDAAELLKAETEKLKEAGAPPEEAESDAPLVPEVKVVDQKP